MRLEGKSIPTRIMSTTQPSVCERLLKDYVLAGAARLISTNSYLQNGGLCELPGIVPFSKPKLLLLSVRKVQNNSSC